MTLDEIMTLVCESMNVTPEQVRSDRRCESKWLNARHVFVRTARMHGFSYPSIGKEINRHHTTAMQYEKEALNE